MPSEDLHKPLKSLNQTVANLREDVQSLTGEVKKIPSIIREATQTIRDAIHENIRAQAELKLMEHLMDVKTIEPQIEAEYDQIKVERNELEARIESIRNRYQRKHTELDKKAESRIRDLGEHIFEIDEEQFGTGIEEPFTEQVTSAWALLQEHNADVTEQRSTVIQDTASEAVQSMHDYIDRQDQLIDTIQEHRLDPAKNALPADNTEPLQVPYYVVEYEQDGVTQQQTVLASQVDSGGSEWCNASLTAVQGATELMENVGRVTDPADRTTLTDEDLRTSLSDYSDSSRLGISYTDAVVEALPDGNGVPVKEEVEE